MEYKVAKKGGKKVFLREDNKEKAIYQKKILYVDYTFTIDPSAPHYINRHSMMINGKTQDITREDLLGLAKRYNIKSAESYIDMILHISIGFG
ncbi:hypothetical protein [Bacteroides cellulosilyticus]|uniref:hypothetical protein n=1 Tax=Bacteroides cellulosilyticus TaxID=246787 RepID=UPI0022DF6B1C|nr:hypothetical protein [Bacteroides cellulosilyticus]